jgi:hypothetical protein
VVFYREDESRRHGNFHVASYECILQEPSWRRRLAKVHTSADEHYSAEILVVSSLIPRTARTRSFEHLLPSNDTRYTCNPVSTRGWAGCRAGLWLSSSHPLRSGRYDCTEIDLKLGDLLIEAKLTEHDFQAAPIRLIERYSGLDEVFDIEALEVVHGTVHSYQLIRGIPLPASIQM